MVVIVKRRFATYALCNRKYATINTPGTPRAHAMIYPIFSNTSRFAQCKLTTKLPPAHFWGKYVNCGEVRQVGTIRFCISGTCFVRLAISQMARDLQRLA